MDKFRQQLFVQWGLPVALFIIALALRVPSLGEFVTVDEPHWINRSRWFATGILFPAQECPEVEWGRNFATQGLGCTLQIGYPGVTTMWAGSLGLLLHYWQSVQDTGQSLQTFLTTLSIYRVDTTLLAPMRLPLAIIGALFVPCFYLLLRRLFSTQLAFIAALLVAVHPFHIALSRVIHHDALNTTFMILSLLMLLGYWLRGWPWYWLLISALMGGLALLSKQVSWFLPPFVAVLAGITWYHRHWGWRTLRRLVGEGILWGLGAVLTFIAFFPAMWTIPQEVLTVIYDTSTTLADDGHTHYFLGRISSDPGLLFYPLGWLFRSSPLEVIGLVMAIWLLITYRPKGQQFLRNHILEISLLLFIGLLFIFVNISNKKMIRYYLPAFPAIDIFIAMALLWGVNRLKQWKQQNSVVWILGGLILIGQGWLTWQYSPYYLTYYNPLLGGVSGASQAMTLVGWGEGLDEAAEYLNKHPQVDSIQVLAERICNIFRPFFVGQVSCLNSTLGGILKADYMVYYYNVIQRDFQQQVQWRYLSRHYRPVYTVTADEQPYVLVYQNPIQYPVDRKVNTLRGILRTFGYNLDSAGALTLVWQKLDVGEFDLLIGIAPTTGVYSADQSVTPSNRQWISCTTDPNFIADLEISKAIIETICPLDSVHLSPGLYDLQLAIRKDGSLIPLKTSHIAVILVDRLGMFRHVEVMESKEAAKGS